MYWYKDGANTRGTVRTRATGERRAGAMVTIAMTQKQRVAARTAAGFFRRPCAASWRMNGFLLGVMGFHFREVVRKGFGDEGVNGGYVLRFLEVDEFGELLKG